MSQGKSNNDKEFRDHNIDILDLWQGNPPDLNPIKNMWSILKKWVDKQKPTKWDQLPLIGQE